MDQVIGAQHEFHDVEFVAGWADRFAPTPKRLELFNIFLSELKPRIPSNGVVVELGIGPGFLADHLLGELSEIRYVGVDFSEPMLDIARQRLDQHSSRVTYVQADLVSDNWWAGIRSPVNAIVSTWALHDLANPETVAAVYKSCAQVLSDGGTFLNGDFIKPDNAIFEYEPGRFEIEKHIAMLRRAGFKNADCLKLLEEEIESPTAAQNYACLRALN